MACTMTQSLQVVLPTGRCSLKRPLVFPVGPVSTHAEAGLPFGSAEILALAATATATLPLVSTAPKVDTRPQPLNIKPKSKPKSKPSADTASPSRMRTRGFSHAVEETPQETHASVKEHFARQEADRKYWEANDPHCPPGTVLGTLPRAPYSVMFPPCPVRAAMGDRTDAYAVETIRAAEAARNNRPVQTCIYCLARVWGAQAGMRIHHKQCTNTPWNRPGLQ